MFPTKKDKIDYIRDYYKEIIFNILKVRVDLLSDDPYTSIKEIILKFYSIFGNYDKLAKYNTILYNPVFNIEVLKTNRKEIFDYFYTRFLATITPIEYSEINKIAILRRLITTKL